MDDVNVQEFRKFGELLHKIGICNDEWIWDMYCIMKETGQLNIKEFLKDKLLETIFPESF